MIGDARLANERLQVTLGERGITAITDVRTKRTHRFVDDGFAAVIDGERFESRTLGRPVMRRDGKDRVTYTWGSGDRQFDVQYELRPGWGFVSKRLYVGMAGRQTMKVGELVPLRATLGDDVAGHFEPRSAQPQRLQTHDYGTALRFSDRSSLLVVAQNPFQRPSVNGRDVAIPYTADMEWREGWGAFASDRVLIAPLQLTGRVLPATMRPEWLIHDPARAPGLDEAEVAAFTDMVRAFMLYQPKEPSRVFVGWTANDYQIDVGTAAGRAEYKSMLDRAAELGAKHVVYAPHNSLLARRRDSQDDWSWEHVLWLGLGEKLRSGAWNPATGEVPPTVKEMVDHGDARGVKLLAYVYPVLGFVQDTSWLVQARPGETRRFADLGVRALQDWLIETLVTFHARTGIGGYAFDHGFLTYSRTSRYAQWYGWRRVMEELRRRVPDIVIDGRQAYHLYGPWSWLAGSYPHPTFHDEQPESFVPFPGLHFSRVSADRERWTAYRYRYYEFAPSELVPGYMTHQTPRSDDTGDMPESRVGNDTLPDRFRARDWDYLGWKYSVLSSIAAGGWNNVIDLIPARDSAERAAFTRGDIAWWRGWIDWTTSHKEILRGARAFLGEPRMGAVDGWAAGAADSSWVFLFNPNGRRLTARVPLDASIGLTSGRTLYVREVYPREGRMLGNGRAGYLSRGDTVEVTLDGQSAMVLRVAAAPAVVAPVVFGSSGDARLADGVLRLTGVRGEPGTTEEVQVALPAGATVRELRVNERAVPFDRAAGGVTTTVTYEGTRFGKFEPIVAYDSTNTGGTVRATLTIPARIARQLADRREAWPMPWTVEEYRATWLASERPLLYVQIAEPDDRWDARLTIDGHPFELRRAYTAVRAAKRTFVGFYADLSSLEPGKAHRIELELPTLRAGQLQGVFVENIEPEYIESIVTR